MATSNYNTMSPSFTHGSPYYHHHPSPSMPQQQLPPPHTQPMPMTLPMMAMPPNPPHPPSHTPNANSPAMPHHLPANSPHQSNPPTSPAMHATFMDVSYQTYCNYLYHVGFLQGNFSDITLSIPSIGKQFALHSLIMSRSPTLYRQLLAQTPSQEPMVMTLEHKGIGEEAFQVVLTHLYRPLTHPELLYLVTERASLALEMMRLSDEWELPLKDMLLHTLLSHGQSEASAREWARLLAPHLENQTRDAKPLLSWLRPLDDQLVQFLIRGLPAKLEAFSTSVRMSGGLLIGKHQANGYMASKTPALRGINDLANVYATLPWIYLKHCLEHPDLPVQDTIQRYWLAGKVLDRRVQLFGPQPPLMRILQFHDTDKNNEDADIMSLTLACASRQRQAGKWDPSLYDPVLEDDDDYEYVTDDE
ncbi:hypothetical protein DM01DRAFT_1404718 [Hesseltinella vesiculosa]|uniref:BTB domain-containing protein n=1 Tax=Hesseltinella vesiculosa TaxID=101127 RepID=A0A1X2GSL5_9FUNG|nr:hypothetical protein DM01DRAFT_1404718 [Hesseltinella vesiculosa]